MPEANTERKKGVWILWLFAVGIFTSFFVFCILLVWFGLNGYSANGFSYPGQDKIGLVEITGPIYTSEPIIQQLDDLAHRSAVRALVLRIDSPGGSVVAAQEVYRELQKIKDRDGLVILTSMGNVAASGGYYIACGSDLIMASPGTITGSIGVIASWTQYDELLNWAKLKDVVIKSGNFKDAGNPARALTPEELAYHQELVDELHAQFVGAVAESRGLPVEQVARLSDGRVVTGGRALDLKLIDEIGNLSDAVERAADLAGLDDDHQLLRRRRDRPLNLIDLLEGYVLRRVADSLDRGRGHSGSGSGFHYLWRAPDLLETP
jgi:protease-4